MKFVYGKIDNVFQWKQPAIPTLVVENQNLFRSLLQDVYLSMDGCVTPVVLSSDNRPLNTGKYMEVISDFVNFSINQKGLLSKICAALERVSTDAEHYLATQKLLTDIENAIEDWGFGFSCNIVANKISVSSLLKAAGVELQDDYHGEIEEVERIIDYMELVREFERDKVFVLVNMRSFYSDEVIEQFLKTALSHEYKILMLESSSRPSLSLENRWTIDQDLCEF